MVDSTDVVLKKILGSAPFGKVLRKYLNCKGAYIQWVCPKKLNDSRALNAYFAT